MNFILEENEEIIKKSADIGYGGKLSRSNNELILTNRSIVLIKKSLLGKVSDIIRFPLSDIAISNGKAQVILDQKDIVTPTLDIYFKSGVQSFRFTWEDEVKEWVNEINFVLTGNSDIYKKDDWAEDILKMTDTFVKASKDVKKVFGIDSDKIMSAKCPSCGASVKGKAKETVECPYCGNYYTFDE